MPGFQCQICNVSLNSPEQLAQHRNGVKHFKKLKEKGVDMAKEPDPVPIKAGKLYGKFVAATSEGKVDLSNSPLFPPPPPPPPKFLMGTKEETSEPVKDQPSQLEISPPPPPPPRGQAAMTGVSARPLLGPPGSQKTNPAGTWQQIPGRPGPKTVNIPRHLRPTAPMGQCRNDFDVQQNDSLSAEKIENLPGINPVMKAVVNNALGNLPLKRKAYSGRCDACELEFNAESQEKQHFNGKKHAKKMRMLSFENSDVSPSVVRATGFCCQFCDVTLNSLEQLEQHRSGTKHKKKVKACQLEGKTIAD